MKDFKGKVTVITGGASGVGRALAFRFGREGAKIVIADIEQKALDRTLAELAAEKIEAIGVVTDVTKYESVEALAEKSFKHFGAVHVVFNNAGVGASETPHVWEAPLTEWQWCFNVNLWGVIHGIKAFMPRLVEQNVEAHIINTSSGNGGVVVMPMTPMYSATKAAVSAITEVLHMQLRAENSPIKVSTLYPGPNVVATGIYNSERNRPKELTVAESGAGKSVHSLEEMKEQMKQMGVELQVTQPEEVADFAYDCLLKDMFWILPLREHTENAAKVRFDNMMARRDPVSPM
jgi:NAD(P)-dependent dehydrogenase (short-subunit alcohol dehydrogenase family)